MLQKRDHGPQVLAKCSRCVCFATTRQLVLPARNDKDGLLTVFASFAFNATPVNILTGSGYDPVSQTAELKVCPVRIEPI